MSDVHQHHKMNKKKSKIEKLFAGKIFANDNRERK